MHTILGAKERNLLIHSEAAKVRAWFYKLIQEHEKITDELLTKLPQDQQVFCKEMLPRILKSASTEWVKEGYDEFPEDDMGDDRVECSLCGKDNKYVYYIVNTKNGTRLNVGSTCITKFDILNREGMPDADLRKLSREGRLTQAFPGILRELDAWDDVLERYPVVIPLEYEEKYVTIRQSINNLVTSYLSSKRHSAVFGEIQPLLETRDDMLSIIDDYVNQELQSNSPLTATRDIARWLQREREIQRLNWLKEDKRIKLRTAIRICEPNFMRSIFPIIKDNLGPSVNVTLQELLEDKRGYVFTHNVQPNIRFFISHRELIPYCGFLTHEAADHLTDEDLINMSEIMIDDTTVLHVLRKFNQSFRGTGWELNEYDRDYNEIFAQNRSVGELRQLKLTQFIDQHRVHLVITKKDTQSTLLKSLNQGTIYTFKSYSEMKQRREDLESGGRKRDG